MSLCLCELLHFWTLIRRLNGYFAHFCGIPAWSCCSCVTTLSEVETRWICVRCSISQINASSWQFTPKLKPCVGDIDGTHALYLQRETLWPGPSASLLHNRPPSSALFTIFSCENSFHVFGILRISVSGPYNLCFLFSLFFLSSQQPNSCSDIFSVCCNNTRKTPELQQ